jgi:tetrahydromethanopterin S-methyltransferase subunit F
LVDKLDEGLRRSTIIGIIIGVIVLVSIFLVVFQPTLWA